MARGTTAVAELILAAGEGRRVGGPKALLEAGPRSLVAHLVRVAWEAGLDAVYVVVGAEEDKVGPQASAAGAIVVAHPGWRRGQTSSLKAGVHALPSSTRAFLVHPVDHAFTTPDDLRALLAAFAAHPRPEHAVLRPVFAGREFGHPVLFGRSLATEFLALEDAEPGHLVYRRHYGEVVLVPVANPLIARDLDRPEDLTLLQDLGRSPDLASDGHGPEAGR